MTPDVASDSTSLTTPAGRLGTAWPLMTVAALAVIWIPALGRGFSADDFSEVPLTWSRVLANPLVNRGRLVETLTFVLLPNQALVQHAANLLLYLGCIWLMWCLCRRMKLGQWPTFLALSSFFHPAFLWSVTWIAQRADLLVIFFLLLAVGTTRPAVKLVWIALCSAAKTPFILQNIVFSLQFARRRALMASVIPLLLILIFGFAGYATYYADTVREGNNLASASIGMAIAAPLRLAKLLEGIFYVFAPIPMFAVAPWGPVVALFAYAVFWFLVTRSLRPFRAVSTIDGWIPLMAMTMCVPFVFSSEVRVTGMAAVLTFLAIASAAHWQRPAKIAIVGILVLNITGILLNYGVFRSKQYDVHAEPISIDYSQPAYVYQVWRESVRQRVLTALGVEMPGGTFE